jgi:hypothetical protein
MTPSEARRILQAYRPDTGDAELPEVAEAMVLVRRDPELRAWFEEHQRVEESLRRKLRSVAPPDDLRTRLTTPRPIPLWRYHVALKAAALIALLAIAIFWWLSRPSPPDRFADFRQRMVASVLRSYHMDVETNDVSEVRGFMARTGSPADFEIPNGLASLELAGGGRLQWRGHPVSLICFDRGDREMLFLFVVRRNAVADAPPAAPAPAQVNKLATLGWSGGENIYLLAGLPEPNFNDRVIRPPR